MCVSTYADNHVNVQASSESSETDYESYDAQTQRSSLAASSSHALDHSSYSDSSLSWQQRAQSNYGTKAQPLSYHLLSCPGMSDALASDEYEGTDFMFLVADYCTP